MLLLTALVAGGCTTGTARPPVTREALDEAIARLGRPLPGDLAALYELRVARSGGLRLAVVAKGTAGRLTISEPFGSAVSLTAWESGAPTVLFDLDEGCRSEVRDLQEVLGVGAIPLAEAVLLLGGRLPATAGADVVAADDGSLTVRGADWAARVRVVPGPWRVVEVSELRDDRRRGWRLELDDHSSSVPGRVRLEHGDGRWAELALTRLEWPDDLALPPLPSLPACADR